QPQNADAIVKRLIKESLPITAGAIVINLSSFIDLLTITNCINISVSKNPGYFLENFTYNLKSVINITEIGNFIYGSYTGILFSIFGLIPSMTAMVSKSAFPSIATAWEQKNTGLIRHNINILLKGTLIVGFPLCMGLSALAEPILNILYFSKPDEAMVCLPPLIILSSGGIFLALCGALFNIFQAIGRSDLQIKIMIIGSGIKLICNLILIPIPWLNISGAAISTLLCYIFICVIGFITLNRIMAKNQNSKIIFLPHFFTSCANSLLCAGGAYIAFKYLPVPGNIQKTAISVVAGGTIYIAATLFTDRKYVLMFFKRIYKRA
ncbi:MAG: polysaccharide biosynthesis C-terminal domain-containing protein, partial [Eubacterium sp.]|nr:polysaccharide biosynthesis C-terminal domain-containing protein [Eubacterium sp.]